MNWSLFPDSKPNKSGYYYTQYNNLDEDNTFYKCIWWNSKINEWVSWRSGCDNSFIDVIRYVEESRSDYYNTCLDIIGEMIHKEYEE